MADRFEDVPPLPREPTAINVPDAMGNPTTTAPAATETPAIAGSLPPPPKFPSLSDVDLSAAKAAAEAQGMPQQPSADASLLSSTITTTTTHPPVDSPPLSDTQPLTDTPTLTDIQTLESDVSTDQNVELLSESTTSRPTSTLHEDIEAAIQRASVTPGTGERKVNEIGQQLWTPADQEELDRLLAEGREVFIPPDVETGDLPAPRSKPYYYVPIPNPHGAESGVDASPDTRTMADRIAIWNEVGTEESESRSSKAGAVAAAGAAGAALGAGTTGTVAAIDDATSTPAEQVESVQTTSPVGDTTQQDTTQQDTTRDIPATQETTTEALEATSQSTTEKSVPTVRSNADVSRSIFGGDFLTVPVISQKAANGTSTVPPYTPDDDLAKTTEVMLRSDASATVNINDDYGLKGGHSQGCYDAVFLDNKTLVTCGADGKVCIWDMSDRSVSKEFLPYDGEAVTMVYPMTDDGDGESYTIMTLSESRLMRIWTVDDKQAVMLRSTQIQSSDKDLFMSVPVISRELKVRATAAAAAAAVRTTADAVESPIETGTAAAGTTATTTAPPEPDTATDAVVGSATADTAAETTAPAAKADEKEEEKDRKRFSFTKVLSFGRSSSRKAVAS